MGARSTNSTGMFYSLELERRFNIGKSIKNHRGQEYISISSEYILAGYCTTIDIAPQFNINIGQHVKERTQKIQTRLENDKGLDPAKWFTEILA